MEESRHLSQQTDPTTFYQEGLNPELLKYYKTSLIIAILKQRDSPISKELRALATMYKRDGDLPLGLDHIRNIDLSYHERQAIGKYVETKILEQVRPFVDKVKRFTGGNVQELASSHHREQYRTLAQEVEREQLSNKLSELKLRKLQLMYVAAEIRTGPYQRNNVELKHAEARSIQSKAELLQKLTASEIFNCTPNAVKALKDVSDNINSLLGIGK